MLEKLHSGTAFDAVKSAKAPRSDSSESARNGTNFQNHYMSADKSQQGLGPTIQRTRDAVDAKQSEISTDVLDEPNAEVQTSDSDTLNLTPSNESDESRTAVEDEGRIAGEIESAAPAIPAAERSSVPNKQSSEPMPSLASEPAPSLGEASKNAPQPGTNEGGATQSAGLAEPRINASQASEKPNPRAEVSLADPRRGQQAYRSPAEIRITSAHSAAQATPAVQTAQVQSNAGQIGQQVAAAAPVAPNNAEVAQEVLSTNVANQQIAAAGQSSPQARNANATNGIMTSAAAIQKNPNALQAVVAGQANKPGSSGLAEALQQMSASEDDVQVSAKFVDDAEGDATVQLTRPKTATSAAAVNQTVQATQSAMTPLIGGNETEVSLDPTKASLMADPLFVEPAGLSQLLTEAVMSPGTTHRPETPRLVAVQLAEALATKGERNIDVALNPEELGRVKMRVSTTDTSVTVMITTERPETGDLMRRHINELSEEFRRMGFEDVKFEFGGEGMSGQMGEGTGQGNMSGQGFAGRGDNELATETKPEVAQKNLNLGKTGMDMRV